MNSKFNKTFYTCLTESSLFLDLMYKYIYFYGMVAALRIFVEPCHEELSSKA